MLKEWEDIHLGARGDAGVLSTEINHAVGEDAVLIHHVFKDPGALIHYFSTTATQHMGEVAPRRNGTPAVDQKAARWGAGRCHQRGAEIEFAFRGDSIARCTEKRSLALLSARWA